MNLTNKLTPIQVLERRKIRLQLRSNELESVLEENFIYMRNHAGFLLRDAAMAVIVSQLPLWLQKLMGRKSKEEDQEGAEQSEISFIAKYTEIIDSALDLFQVFFKGKKLVAATLAIRLIRIFIRS